MCEMHPLAQLGPFPGVGASQKISYKLRLKSFETNSTDRIFAFWAGKCILKITLLFV
jgi:hypothetical protein